VGYLGDGGNGGGGGGGVMGTGMGVQEQGTGTRNRNQGTGPKGRQGPWFYRKGKKRTLFTSFTRKVRNVPYLLVLLLS